MENLKKKIWVLEVKVISHTVIKNFLLKNISYKKCYIYPGELIVDCRSFFNFKEGKQVNNIFILFQLQIEQASY